MIYQFPHLNITPTVFYPTPFLHLLHTNSIDTSGPEESKNKQSKMASTSAVSMAMPLTYAAQRSIPTSLAFFKPLPLRHSAAKSAASKPLGKFEVRASLKEKAVAGLTAVALTTSMMIPQVAEAADSGVSPSLQNFLLSIGAGGVVLLVLLGAVLGVSNFDPVKRG